jgi:hypothetical protein
MATYTVRRHPELDAITEYDKEKLAEVIEQYNEWYNKHVKASDRQNSGDTWTYAIWEIYDKINENMVNVLSTLEETKYVKGKGYSFFSVSPMFSNIDIIRNEYISPHPHPTLMNMEPEKLMPILDDLEVYTRRVIQNTSIRRLHAKSWVHSDALVVNGGGESVSGRDDALVGPGGISSLLGRMKQTCI